MELESGNAGTPAPLGSSCQVHNDVVLLLTISGREFAFWQLMSTELTFSYFCYNSKLSFSNGSDQFSELIKVSVQFGLSPACPSF